MFVDHTMTQDKLWTKKKASRKRISKHMLKTVPVYATIDNNDRVQDALTRKGTIHDTIRFFVNVILNQNK